MLETSVDLLIKVVSLSGTSLVDVNNQFICCATHDHTTQSTESVSEIPTDTGEVLFDPGHPLIFSVPYKALQSLTDSHNMLRVVVIRLESKSGQRKVVGHVDIDFGEFLYCIANNEEKHISLPLSGSRSNFLIEFILSAFEVRQAPIINLHNYGTNLGALNLKNDSHAIISSPSRPSGPAQQLTYVPIGEDGMELYELTVSLKGLRLIPSNFPIVGRQFYFRYRFFGVTVRSDSFPIVDAQGGLTDLMEPVSDTFTLRSQLCDLALFLSALPALVIEFVCEIRDERREEILGKCEVPMASLLLHFPASTLPKLLPGHPLSRSDNETVVTCGAYQQYGDAIFPFDIDGLEPATPDPLISDEFEGAEILGDFAISSVKAKLAASVSLVHRGALASFYNVSKPLFASESVESESGRLKSDVDLTSAVKQTESSFNNIVSPPVSKPPVISQDQMDRDQLHLRVQYPSCSPSASERRSTMKSILSQCSPLLEEPPLSQPTAVDESLMNITLLSEDAGEPKRVSGLESDISLSGGVSETAPSFLAYSPSLHLHHRVADSAGERGHPVSPDNSFVTIGEEEEGEDAVVVLSPLRLHLDHISFLLPGSSTVPSSPTVFNARCKIVYRCLVHVPNGPSAGEEIRQETILNVPCVVASSAASQARSGALRLPAGAVSVLRTPTRIIVNSSDSVEPMSIPLPPQGSIELHLLSLTQPGPAGGLQALAGSQSHSSPYIFSAGERPCASLPLVVLSNASSLVHSTSASSTQTPAAAEMEKEKEGALRIRLNPGSAGLEEENTADAELFAKAGASLPRAGRLAPEFFQHFLPQAGCKISASDGNDNDAEISISIRVLPPPDATNQTRTERLLRLSPEQAMEASGLPSTYTANSPSFVKPVAPPPNPSVAQIPRGLDSNMEQSGIENMQPQAHAIRSTAALAHPIILQPLTHSSNPFLPSDGRESHKKGPLSSAATLERSLLGSPLLALSPFSKETIALAAKVMRAVRSQWVLDPSSRGASARAHAFSVNACVRALRGARVDAYIAPAVRLRPHTSGASITFTSKPSLLADETTAGHSLGSGLLISQLDEDSGRVDAATGTVSTPLAIPQDLSASCSVSVDFLAPADSVYPPVFFLTEDSLFQPTGAPVSDRTGNPNSDSTNYRRFDDLTPPEQDKIRRLLPDGGGIDVHLELFCWDASTPAEAIDKDISAVVSSISESASENLGGEKKKNPENQAGAKKKRDSTLPAPTQPVPKGVRESAAAAAGVVPLAAVFAAARPVLRPRSHPEYCFDSPESYSFFFLERFHFLLAETASEDSSPGKASSDRAARELLRLREEVRDSLSPAIEFSSLCDVPVAAPAGQQDDHMTVQVELTLLDHPLQGFLPGGATQTSSSNLAPNPTSIKSKELLASYEQSHQLLQQREQDLLRVFAERQRLAEREAANARAQRMKTLEAELRAEFERRSREMRADAERERSRVRELEARLRALIDAADERARALAASISESDSREKMRALDAEMDARRRREAQEAQEALHAAQQAELARQLRSLREELALEREKNAQLEQKRAAAAAAALMSPDAVLRDALAAAEAEVKVLRHAAAAAAQSSRESEQRTREAVAEAARAAAASAQLRRELEVLKLGETERLRVQWLAREERYVLDGDRIVLRNIRNALDEAVHSLHDSAAEANSLKENTGKQIASAVKEIPLRPTDSGLTNQAAVLAAQTITEAKMYSSTASNNASSSADANDYSNNLSAFTDRTVTEAPSVFVKTRNSAASGQENGNSLVSQLQFSSKLVTEKPSTPEAALLQIKALRDQRKTMMETGLYSASHTLIRQIDRALLEAEKVIKQSK